MEIFDPSGYQNATHHSLQNNMKTEIEKVSEESNINSIQVIDASQSLYSFHLTTHPLAPVVNINMMCKTNVKLGMFYNFKKIWKWYDICHVSRGMQDITSVSKTWTISFD